MTFCIVSHVIHIEKENNFFAYSPYINEMDVWIKHFDDVLVVAPKAQFELNPIHAHYQHKNVKFIPINKFDILTSKGILTSLFSIPINCWSIFKAMKKADHIHLRCPGNIGLLGCIVQIAFPKKKKSAKYAGNWDPKAKQPLSYRIQKRILSNTFLTKNIQVLVYGEWENQSINIKPFFTATYLEKDKIDIAPRVLHNTIEFIFVGSLTVGKQPLYAIKIVEELKKRGFNLRLNVFGEGVEKEKLVDYCSKNNLTDFIFIKGNLHSKELIKEYQKSHFLLLPSKSEGWPKVVAEAMFWGCLPIATKVSCIQNMLDFGNQGILLSENLELDLTQIIEHSSNQELYNLKVEKAINWSRNYTVDKFESEIKKIILT
jgi:glycosyltransferase involved in cell wall biosynthesis